MLLEIGPMWSKSWHKTVIRPVNEDVSHVPEVEFRTIRGISQDLISHILVRLRGVGGSLLENCQKDPGRHFLIESTILESLSKLSKN